MAEQERKQTGRTEETAPEVTEETAAADQGEELDPDLDGPGQRSSAIISPGAGE